MDTLRGNFSDRADEPDAYDPIEDEDDREDPPALVDGDERRMQVRAYNHWASLLEDRNFPAIEDLEPENLPSFGPYSVLLDFSAGIENPGIAYLGDELAKECGAEGEISSLADVPPRSLLSRITDHYMQILANQAPIGFEAEFVNQRGATILYRGILLPFSSDDDTIDFIYGVINWKEMADQQAADALLLEIDQALEGEDDSGFDEDDDAGDPFASRPMPRLGDTPLTDWADGPAADRDAAFAGDDDDHDDDDDDVLDLSEVAEDSADEPAPLPRPRFGSLLEMSHSAGGGQAADALGNAVAVPGGDYHTPEPTAFEPDPGYVAEFAEPFDPEAMALGDWLAAARELAEEARRGEARTRTALYEAIGRAYDFSLAAREDPDGFEELLADAGLAAQERAPMTPVVKLVFGADYDKTRITEFAAALAHAHRHRVERGALAAYLRQTEGGLKGVVAAERQLRRAESGVPAEAADAPRPALARKLRAVEPRGFEAIAADGPEFALVMLRRVPGGGVMVVGEVPDDVPLVERAARKLLA